MEIGKQGRKMEKQEKGEWKQKIIQKDGVMGEREMKIGKYIERWKNRKCTRREMKIGK